MPTDRTEFYNTRAAVMEHQRKINQLQENVNVMTEKMKRICPHDKTSTKEFHSIYDHSHDFSMEVCDHCGAQIGFGEPIHG